MKTAREIILNVLNEELPFINGAFLDPVADRIVKELGMTDVKLVGVENKGECKTFTSVRYDVEISVDDIRLVKKYNGSSRELFLDPLYMRVLESYFQLLGTDRANTLEISREECLLNALSANEGREESKWITGVSNPLEVIRRGINGVCDAIGLYRTYEFRYGSKSNK